MKNTSLWNQIQEGSLKVTNHFSTSIHIVLKDLIEAKSKRDQIKFTGYQLANALAMPRSIITKLTHPDVSKRIVNPRIETLIKIIDFFRKDGFEVKIDDLLSVDKTIEIQSLSPVKSVLSTIQLYSLDNAREKIGVIDIALGNECTNVVGFKSLVDMTPLFKAGSIFIVNTNIKPEHDNLIAIRLNSEEQISIKKYYKQKNKVILKSLDDKNDGLMLQPTDTCQIIGVVIQVNAKT